MQIHMSIIIGRLSQLDHGRVETNFGYRTWKFQYLCNFLSTMEWSGPNIQDPLCQYNKNEKILNYLVTTHERFQFGISFLVNGFFGKYPICNSVKHPNYDIFLFKTIPRELGPFFLPKHSKGFVSNNCLWKLDIFHEKRFYFNFFKFQQFTFVCCCHFCLFSCPRIKC